MKKITSIFMIAVMVCSLSGCSQGKTNLQEKADQQEGSSMPMEGTIQEEKEKASAGGEDNTNPQGEAIQEEGKISDSERAEQNKAYGEILWDVYYLGEIEGREYTAPNWEGNKNGGFLVYDIDGDGLEELLLWFDGGYMATNVEYIWGYENGSTHVELCEWPSIRCYYDNGIIEVNWSHDHGLPGPEDFWPYTVYNYNSETDEYQEFAKVDAWDISTEIEVLGSGEAFPSSIDADGDGIVYRIRISPADEDEYYVDGKDYESWRNSYLNGAEEMSLKHVNNNGVWDEEEVIIFQSLNEENISKLGAPKPDIQFPEPQG